jgi:hypothetical protein
MLIGDEGGAAMRIARRVPEMHGIMAGIIAMRQPGGIGGDIRHTVI